MPLEHGKDTLRSCKVMCLRVSSDCINSSFFCSTPLNFPDVMKMSHPMICKTQTLSAGSWALCGVPVLVGIPLNQ